MNSSAPKVNKIGRNEQCPCGSGKKFKKCHGSFETMKEAPPGLQAAAAEAYRRHQAKEAVRQRQQGFGKPIITAELKGSRIVCVANRVMWSNKWRFFPDFLLAYLKETLGHAWGDANRSSLDHPVFRWLERLTSHPARVPDGPVVAQETGYITGVFGLGYALYLLAHHDQVLPDMVAKLRDPKTFRPTMYEAVVGAAFAVAGFKIETGEAARGSVSKPEFWVTSPSQQRYAVEAKLKVSWKATCDPDNAEFAAELRQWIRDRFYEAARKGLPNPIYWFELSIPAPLPPEAWTKIHDLIVANLREAETMTVAGQTVSPAYIFVTNNSHFVNDDTLGSPFFAMAEGYRMDDFRSGVTMEIEAALAAYDKHRDISWVLDCLKEIQRIPITFDGYPSEMLNEDGQPLTTMQIGQPISVESPNGEILTGVMEDITASGDNAWVVVRKSETNERVITQIPLTSQEQEGIKRHGDQLFGKATTSKSLGDDPFALYQWFLDTFRGYDRKALLNQVGASPRRAEFEALSDPDLRTRVARELTKAMVARRDKPSTSKPVEPTDAV